MKKEQELIITKALKEGNLPYLTALLNDNTDWLPASLRNNRGNQRPAIHYASEYGQLEIVKLLLEKKPDLLNLTDSVNQTPILWAAAQGHEPVVDYLLSMGADLTIATYCDGVFSGYAPIHWAVRNGHVAVVRCLMRHGADIHIRVSKMRYHPIHIASIDGCLDVVQVLLAADPGLLNILDTKEQSPILWAAAEGHESVVDYLLSMGADMDVCTMATHWEDAAVSGYAPIHWAVKNGHVAVVRCLMRHGADIHIRVGERQHHPIHIASMYGRLDVVKLLLEKGSDLLKIADRDNQTPILLAITNDHPDVLAYLLSEYLHLDLITNHLDYLKMLLAKAMGRQSYRAANVLILKIMAFQPKDEILPFVKNSQQAIDLMISEPTLIPMFIQDNKIMHLIAHSCENTTQQHINWYSSSRRRPSFFLRIDRDNGNFSLFTPVKELGEGTYGRVRLFQTADGQEIAVKSLKKPIVNISQARQRSLINSLKKEREFNKKIYPNDQFFKIFEICHGKNEKKLYDNRYVMPYVKGQVGKVLIPQITCLRELAEIVLQVILELERIHALGIIHGDLHFDNVLIDCRADKTWMVRLIDFGFSYYLTESSAILWNADALGRWTPPELCNNKVKPVQPHPNQDIFALGYSLQRVMSKNPLCNDLMCSFPSIETFILDAQSVDPMARPSLASFRINLSEELNSKTEVHALGL